MKSLVFMTAVFATTFAFCEQRPGAEKKALSLEERQSRKDAFQEKLFKRTGGFVERTNTTGRRFAFVNMQSVVPQSELTEPIRVMTRVLSRKIVLEPFAGKFIVNDADELLKKADAAGAVFVVDDPAVPRLLIAPESKWAMINVAALNSDKPDALVLAKRVRNEMWRSFAMLNGAANTIMGKCLLQTAFTNADLDALDAEAFCPEPVNKINAHLDRAGVKKFERCSYKRACEEGWAPAPTNEIQKAVYEMVKAEQAKSPTKGIKINYDPKVGK